MGLFRAESREHGDCPFAGPRATPRDCPRFPDAGTHPSGLSPFPEGPTPQESCPLFSVEGTVPRDSAPHCQRNLTRERKIRLLLGNVQYQTVYDSPQTQVVRTLVVRWLAITSAHIIALI